MKKKILLAICFTVVLFGCRTSKSLDTVGSASIVSKTETETTTNKKELSSSNEKQDSETSTSYTLEEIEYFMPMPGDPTPIPKSIKKTTYDTQDKSTKELIDNYEKWLDVKEKRIEELEGMLHEAISKFNITDSRIIQGKEWIYVGIAAVVTIIIIALCILWYVRKYIAKRKL